jgi:TRAP-type C4-dicarboxylate transport system permease small subunit
MKRFLELYHRWLRVAVFALAVLSGAGIMVMIGVTCIDVLLRIFGRALVGALDIVMLASAVTIACALPYTTAVKGHVAIEYFFQKLGRRGRIIVDSAARTLAMTLFVLLSVQCIRYGNSVRASGEGSLTLQIPLFWVPYLIGLCCALTVLVILYNLTHPGREMIKP